MVLKRCTISLLSRHLGLEESKITGHSNKREKIAEAIKLAVKNAYVDVEQGQDGFVYSLNDRGEKIIAAIQSPYVKSYMLGAKIITRKFARTSDEDILKYISKMATESKEA